MTNADIVWERLMMDIGNRYGCAGLMGNLFAESSLNPLCKTGGNKKVSGKEYAEKIDNNDISCSSFAKDGAAFGIAQWRYWTRKEKLYLLAKEKDVSIGDLDLQLTYLLDEIKTYKTVYSTLCSAKSVKEASDIVLERYEKPANVGEAAKKKRADFGQRYFDQYCSVPEPSNNDIPVKEVGNEVVITSDNVNFREGNGKKYAIVGQCKKAGTIYPYVASSSDDWHAIVAEINHRERIVWVCGDFAKRQ